MIESRGGKNVLITGATKGLGLMIARSYADKNTVHITHRWGSANENDIFKSFSDAGLIPPKIHCSDSSDKNDILNLIESIHKEYGMIDVFICNLSFSKVSEGFLNLKKNTLDLSLSYSAWPLVFITQTIYKITGQYPSYIIAISSNGPEVCHPGYEYAACSKSVMETMVRYMANELSDFNSRINAVRPGYLKTESSKITFGVEYLVQLYNDVPELFVDVKQVADVCVALSSGLMDAVNGQIITADAGQGLMSPLQLYKNFYDKE